MVKEYIPKYLEIKQQAKEIDANGDGMITQGEVAPYNIIKKELHQQEDIARVALEHQEKYSGLGYPNGLKGKEIHLYAQVAAICDVYDALVSQRVYKPALPSHEAIKIMLSEGSRSFNPFMLYKFIYLANYKDTAKLITPDGPESLTPEQVNSMDTTI